MYQQPFDNASKSENDSNDSSYYHNHHDYFSSHSYDPSFLHFNHNDIAADPLIPDSYAHSLDSSSFLLDDETFFLHQLQPEQPEFSSWDFAVAAAAAGLLPPASEHTATTGADFSLLPEANHEHHREHQQPPLSQQTQQPQKQLSKKQSRADCVIAAPKHKRRSTASAGSSASSSTTSTSANTNDKKIDHSRRLTELQARFRVHLTSRQNSSKKGGAATADRNSQHQQRALPPPVVAAATDQFIKTIPSSSAPSSSSSAAAEQQQQRPTPESSSSSSSYFPSRTMPIQIHRVHGRPNSLSVLDIEKRQRQLDQQLESVDFEDVTVAELKEMLRQRGKQATGKKAVLVQRLKAEREHRRLEALKDPLPSPTTLINRSMAAMQLNSPGGGGNRRFMPYGGTVIGGQQQRQQLQQQHQGQHKYAPVISSALATPEHDEEVNPFDHLIMQYNMDMVPNESVATPSGIQFPFSTSYTNQGYFDGFHQSM